MKANEGDSFKTNVILRKKEEFQEESGGVRRSQEVSLISDVELWINNNI